MWLLPAILLRSSFLQESILLLLLLYGMTVVKQYFWHSLFLSQCRVVILSIIDRLSFLILTRRLCMVAQCCSNALNCPNEFDGHNWHRYGAADVVTEDILSSPDVVALPEVTLPLPFAISSSFRRTSFRTKSSGDNCSRLFFDSISSSAQVDNEWTSYALCLFVGKLFSFSRRL